MDPPPTASAGPITIGTMDDERQQRDQGAEEPEETYDLHLLEGQEDENTVDHHQETKSLDKAFEHLVPCSVEMERMAVQFQILVIPAQTSRLCPWIVEAQGDEGEQHVHDENDEKVTAFAFE